MKKTILILTVISATLFAFIPVGMNIKIKGSDTVLPLSQKEAEVYMKEHKDASITVIGGGSGVGIAALIDGTTDICQSSRKMKIDEKQKLLDAGKSPKEV